MPAGTSARRDAAHSLALSCPLQAKPQAGPQAAELIREVRPSTAWRALPFDRSVDGLPEKERQPDIERSCIGPANVVKGRGCWVLEKRLGILDVEGSALRQTVAAHVCC